MTVQHIINGSFKDYFITLINNCTMAIYVPLSSNTTAVQVKSSNIEGENAPSWNQIWTTCQCLF